MKNKLHEGAKLLAGLVLGDFFMHWWLLTHHGFPVDLLGLHITSAIVAPTLIFDAALFILLVHYAWHIGKTPFLRERSYLMIAAVVFGVIAAAHLVRAFTGVDVNIAGWDVPVWLSWIGTAASAYLSYMSFHLAARMK